MAWGGIHIRKSGDRVVIEARLADDVGGLLTGGTTTAKLFEIQSDGTLKSYDFNDNTFKTTALTTATLALTHRKGNNSTQDTGLWTAAITTVTGFTLGARYRVLVENASAAPPAQLSDPFQYGGVEGDGLPIATVTTDAGNSATSFETDLTESTNDYWKDSLLLILTGALAGQLKKVSAYNGTTKIITVTGGFTGTPADGIKFMLVNR